MSSDPVPVLLISRNATTSVASGTPLLSSPYATLKDLQPNNESGTDFTVPNFHVAGIWDVTMVE